MKKCIIIYNPNSGKMKNINFFNQFCNILYKYNYECCIYPTSYAGHARKIIKQIPEVDLVISIGGDGTFNEIVTGNIERKKTLLVAHIPYGTTNDIGNMFGYQKNILENLNLLMKGSIQDVDICTINNQPFVYVAGFGKFVNISYETPRELKKKFGYLAYLIEGLKELNGETNLYDLKYTINGETYEGSYSFIMISNANRIAGIDNFYKNVKLNDSKFEVLFCNLKNKKDIIKSLYYLKTKDITEIPGFYFYKTNYLKIEFKKDIEVGWSIDGEKFSNETHSFEINIVPKFKILMPKKNIKKLFIGEE